MNVEIKDGAVLRDGEQVGTVDAAGAFVPNDGLHPKTTQAVAKAVASQVGVTPPKEDKPKKNGADDPEPERTELGCIDLALVDWRERNWSPAQFAEVYPPARLAAIRGE